MNSSSNKRKERDLMKLMMSNFDVHLSDENNPNDLYVIFKGPKESPYEGGTWKVHVLIPDQYPYKSPSIGFHNKIYHPNVDEVSGTVCLDVINQTWSPMYDLINIFEAFLPQLLLYPNPTDPLNGEAARMLLKDSEKYNEKVKEYIKFYASENLTFKADKKENGKENHNGQYKDGKEESESEASELSNASIEVEDC